MLNFTALLNSPNSESYPIRGRELAHDESDSGSEDEEEGNSELERPPSPTPASRNSTPKGPGQKRLKRDKRRDIQLMRSLGYTQVETAKALGVTVRAVQYTDQRGYATPKRKSGRPPKLGPAEVEELIAYVTANEENRQKTYQELALEFQDIWPHLEIGYQSIKYALRANGFSRRKALKKPRIDAECAELRLRFALNHVHWSETDWINVLWTDETWVGAGQHRRVFVTVRKGEQLHPDCVVTAYRHKVAWMFWGSFHGLTKGPCLFWERKQWGTITGESYSNRIVPLVDNCLKLHPELLFMQDNARAHTAKITMEEFEKRGIQPIKWPPNSPDMNPIEKIWNKMKDWIQERYPKMVYSLPRLRVIVQEAWDAITEDDLREVLLEMPKRMQAVIDADGYHTKY